MGKDSTVVGNIVPLAPPLEPYDISFGESRLADIPLDCKEVCSEDDLVMVVTIPNAPKIPEDMEAWMSLVESRYVSSEPGLDGQIVKTLDMRLIEGHAGKLISLSDVLHNKWDAREFLLYVRPLPADGELTVDREHPQPNDFTVNLPGVYIGRTDVINVQLFYPLLCVFCADFAARQWSSGSLVDAIDTVLYCFMAMSFLVYIVLSTWRYRRSKILHRDYNLGLPMWAMLPSDWYRITILNRVSSI